MWVNVVEHGSVSEDVGHLSGTWLTWYNIANLG